MKKIGILLAAVLLLCSCNSNPAPQDYCNTTDGCLLGSTYYKSFAGLDIQLWNPAWDTVMEGLCRDPLCSHDSTDSLCPSSMNLQLKTVVTDGERLYLNALNFLLTDENATMYRQIFSVNQDGSDFKLLHTYDATGNSSPYMKYADGYLYFEQGFYNENYDPMSEHKGTEMQSMHVMRISVDGGKAEQVLSGEYTIGSSFYVDADNYYLFSADDNGVYQLDIIDPKTKAVRENVLPEVNDEFYDITVYAEKTWLQTFDGDLYVLDDGEFARVCEGKGIYTFGGGIWYTEQAEPVYVGTKEMPTGAAGGETAPYDYFVEATTKLCRIDPDDLSITEFIPSDDFDDEDTIVLSYVSENGIRAGVSNGRKKFEDPESGYNCLIRCEDGSVTIEKTYE